MGTSKPFKSLLFRSLCICSWAILQSLVDETEDLWFAHWCIVEKRMERFHLFCLQTTFISFVLSLFCFAYFNIEMNLLISEATVESMWTCTRLSCILFSRTRYSIVLCPFDFFVVKERVVFSLTFLPFLFFSLLMKVFSVNWS